MGLYIRYTLRRPIAFRAGSGTIAGGASSPGVQPAACEACPLETTAQIGTAAHDAPDEAAAEIFDHGDGQAFINAEVIVVDPTHFRYDSAIRELRVGVIEAEIEGIHKAKGRVDVPAVLFLHQSQGRYGDLRRKRQRARHRVRRQRPVVIVLGAARTAGCIGMECASLTVVLELRLDRT